MAKSLIYLLLSILVPNIHPIIGLNIPEHVTTIHNMRPPHTVKHNTDLAGATLNLVVGDDENIVQVKAYER